MAANPLLSTRQQTALAVIAATDMANGWPPPSILSIERDGTVYLSTGGIMGPQGECIRDATV